MEGVATGQVTMSDRNDPYSRANYRHMIAWPARIQREAPLLLRVLRSGPSNRILDLGSGPGDHARWLATEGFEVVGVDASEEMLGMATEETVPENVRFVLGDFRDLPRLVDGTFGGAICLGNALPHLTDENDLRALASGLAAVLSPGATVILQLLNYDRIAATGERHLPLNFRDDPEGGPGEVIYLRAMTMEGRSRVRFYPTALRLLPGADPPIEVISSREVELRAWGVADLATIFGTAGIEQDDVVGGYDASPFEAASSRDLIWIGRRT